MSGIELKGLKGLSALLENSKESSSTNNALMLPVNQLKAGALQPRTVFDDEGLQSLVYSIKENGIIQPLVVREIEVGYEIIIGERRWRAAQLAGLNEVPVLIRNVSNHVAAVYALVENIQREDLNPIDQAVALSRLVTEYSMTHEHVSKIVGISRSAVTNLIRLLSLAENVQKSLSKGKLEIGHAKVILSLGKNGQEAISNKIIEKNLSVREAENLVKKIKFLSTEIELSDQNKEDEVEEWNKKLTEKLDKNVNIYLNKSGKGEIRIKFNTKEDVKWLVDHLEIK